MKKYIILLVLPALIMLSSCKKPVEPKPTPEDMVSGWYMIEKIHGSTALDLDGNGIGVYDYLDEFYKVPGYIDKPIFVKKYMKGVLLSLSLPYPVLNEDMVCEGISFLQMSVPLEGYKSLYQFIMINPSNYKNDDDPFIKTIENMHIEFLDSDTFEVGYSCTFTQRKIDTGVISTTIHYTFKK